MIKNNLVRKIVSFILVLSFILPTISVPQEAKAQMAVVEVNSTTSLFQQIIGVAENIWQSALQYSDKWKEFVGDGLARAFAQQLTRAMTSSIVNWINSGFEGSPSFVTNPSSFFLDVADQITGEFLAKTGGPLSELCSPFSIDIRLSLAFKYHPNVRQKYQCTLGEIIKNSKNAVKGASINGFTAGDFSQGGWPAFVTMTTQPQNNMIGAYLRAESELSFRVANAQLQQRDEISAGRGFLSWRDPSCLNKIKKAKQTASEAPYNPDNTYDPANTSEANGGIMSPTDCPIMTPGSTIAETLNLHLGTSLRQAEIADEINEIINALFSQLVTQVLTKGLSGASGSGPSDSSSYINQLQNEANLDQTYIDAIRKNLLQDIDTYIKNSGSLVIIKNSSYEYINSIHTTYLNARACYVSLSAIPLQTSYAQRQIRDIDEILSASTTVNALASETARLQTESIDAADRLVKLQSIKEKATSAKTLQELDVPNKEYLALVQGQKLTTPTEVSQAEQELKQLKKDFKDDANRANKELRECQEATRNPNVPR